MAFIMRFAEHWIRDSMEDPREREEKNIKHLRKVKETCDKLLAQWAMPVKPYGFWNNDKNNHKYLMDVRLSKLSGRQSPYDKNEEVR
eukprot:jgi/Mesen1/4656/ME000241S03697